MKTLKKLACLLALFLATPLVGAALTLGWDASPDAVNYTLYWGLLTGTNHASPTNTTVTGNVTTYTLPNIPVPGLSYWFVLAAKDANNVEVLTSNEIQATGEFPVPDHVTNFRYTSYTLSRLPTTLTLNWTPVATVPLSNYKFYWGIVNTNTGVYTTTNTILLPATAVTMTVSNLVTFNTYDFYVTAISATNNVEGIKSDEIRYYVAPPVPRPAGSFHQVITVVPQ